MFKLLTFAALLSTATAAALAKKIDYKKVVDVSTATSVDDFKCLKKAGYYGILATVYTADNGGSIPAGAEENVFNANKAGFTFHDVALEVNPTLAKSGSDQAKEALDALAQTGIYVQHVWLKLSTRIPWYSDKQQNVQFLSDLMTYFVSTRGVRAYIFTSQSDYDTIIGDADNLDGLPLWYSNVKWIGRSGATDPNFNDFTPFDGWLNPVGKEYARDVTDVCSLEVNLDVVDPARFSLFPEMIALTPAAKKAQEHGMIVAGTLFNL